MLVDDFSIFWYPTACLMPCPWAFGNWNHGEIMYSTQREGGGDYKVVFGKPFFGRHGSGHSMGGEGVDLSLANNSIFSQRRSSLFLILSLAKNPMDSHGSTRHRCLYMYMYIINKEKSYRRTQLYAYS